MILSHNRILSALSYTSTTTNLEMLRSSAAELEQSRPHAGMPTRGSEASTSHEIRAKAGTQDWRLLIVETRPIKSCDYSTQIIASC